MCSLLVLCGIETHNSVLHVLYVGSVKMMALLSVLAITVQYNYTDDLASKILHYDNYV